MAAQAFDVGNFDPYKALEQSRTVAGVIKTGAITYDIDFLDPNNNPIYSRWIYIGTTGNISYIKWDGSTETLPNIAPGVWHPIFATRVLSSGTTIAANQLRWGA